MNSGYSGQDDLSNHLSKLLDSEEWTDVTFIVEGEQVKAHRCILASRCKYFRTHFAESTQKEIPMAVKAEPFKFILRYLYTGRSEFSNKNTKQIVDILDLAHQYGIVTLVWDTGKYLAPRITLDTIHSALNAAVFYDIKELLAASLKFADENAPSVVSHVAFASLRDVAVKELLKRDSFGAAEIDIFKAVKAWGDKRPTRINADILGLVRWSLITSDDLFKVVRPSRVVSPDVLLNAMEQQVSGKLPLRGVLGKGKEFVGKFITGKYMDLGCIYLLNFIAFDEYESHSPPLVHVSVDSKYWKKLDLRKSIRVQVTDMHFIKKHCTFPLTAVRFIASVYNTSGTSQFVMTYRSHEHPEANLNVSK